MKAYRVEDQERGHGIWRDFDGTVNPVFSQLTQGKCKDMPMEDNDFYRYDGKQWFSATDTPEKLKVWFSALDVIEMQDLGYSVFEFDISSCRVVSKYEICFTRDSILSQKKIDPRSIYGEEYEKALAERSKEKQIEEMALELCRPRNIVKMIHHRTCDNCDTSSCDIYELCVDLYNAGYRKQSEGEWEQQLRPYEDEIVCSVCGANFNVIDNCTEKFNHCPNCGARMSGGQNEQCQ